MSKQAVDGLSCQLERKSSFNYPAGSNSNSVNTKAYTIPWRRSRLAARILIQASKRALSPRRQVLALALSKDPGVTNRLVKQALLSLYAKQPHLVCLD